MASLTRFVAVVFCILVTSSTATTCSGTLQSSYSTTVAAGYQAALVATGLARPRGIHFDEAGHLLVVEAPRDGRPAITALTLRDGGGLCIEEASRKIVVDGQGQVEVFTHTFMCQVNHGIALSSDGTTLYASSEEAAMAWTYDSTSQSASRQRTLVGAMSGSDHVTRTLLLSRKVDDVMIISRGSTSNIDPLAIDVGSGISQIRAFDISNISSLQNYTYASDGLRLGWGLRNSVGLAEHPVTGGIWSVENSADNMKRDAVSVREDNPGEELNFHGYLNNTGDGGPSDNYGYPQCYAAWNVASLPLNDNLSVGSQFAADGAGGNDTYCAAQVAPKLTFLAHQAPLDIKFNDSGREAWISFHGSWNRDSPSGYKLSMVPFDNGQPVAASDSVTATIDIFSNLENSVCPGDCFWPAGLAFDDKGRLFMTSDASGEIYVIMRDDSSASKDSDSPPASFAGRSRVTSTGIMPSVMVVVVGLLTLV